MLDQQGEWAVSCEDTLAFIMTRQPLFEVEDPYGDYEGEILWAIDELAFRWVSIPYLEPGECDHNDEPHFAYGVTMCPDCQEKWFQDYNVRLVSKDNTEIFVDFDILVRAEHKKQGIPEPSLRDYLMAYFEPSV